MATDAAKPTGRRGWFTRRRAAVVLLVVIPLGWLSVAGVSKAVTVRVYHIPSGSMAPTLKAGDRVGVQTRPGRAPARGEVWVFRMPRASGSAGEAVKRVVGLPGDTVEVKAGVLLVNGLPASEPYLTGPMTYTMPALKLGPAEYLMLGDSRNASHDGHVWGPLPADHLVGPVALRYWPVRRLGGL